MEFLPTILSLAALPVSSIELAFAALAAAVFFKWRQTALTEKTSNASSYKETMDALLHQINTLSEQLNSTRLQLNDLHDRNVDLMNQLREANFKITELEIVLKSLGHNLPLVPTE